jgi:hypothetical protein
LRKELPVWALPVAIAVGLLLLALIGWRTFSAQSGDTGPAKEVRPGMYDFRQEVRSGNVGRRHRADTGNGSP